MNHPTARHVHVAIAGSGFAGLGMAIRLKQEGRDDFLIFERAHEVGGVWRDNSYPGCACDVQSHLYSFSFAPNPDWSRSYSPQPEIQAYLQGCADRFGIRPHVRFGHTIEEAVWQADQQHWRLQTTQGVYTADVFVSGVGGLSEPSLPRLPGLESFRGRVFHSARWDHSYDLTGRNVAVVGTGASAIQFVPAIQPKVGKLTLFQRTPPWIVPREDRAFSDGEKRRWRRSGVARWLTRASIYARRELMAIAFLHPRLARLGERMALQHLERSVSDPALRKKLTPSYRLGCKRVLVSDDYLPSLTRPNVELVTAGIQALRPHAIVGNDGVEHPVDAIIFGTGFHTTDVPFARHVVGKDGRTLDDVWAGSPRAHLGTTVAGFPNFFFLQGPNTGLGHTSVIIMIESQIAHVLGALRFMRRRGVAAVEPRADAQQAFVDEVDAKMRTTVWSVGGCSSWYLDRTGRNSTLWPGYTFSFKRRVERFVPADYVAEAPAALRADADAGARRAPAPTARAAGGAGAR